MKLLIREVGSTETGAIVHQSDEHFASSIGYVEARSALGAAARTGRVGRARQNQSRSELERIWRGVDVVQLDDRLVQSAGDVSEDRRLRAGDAIHLASALVVDEPELVFVTWDHELARAAREVGLAVAP